MKTEITVDVDRSHQLGRPRKNKDKAQSIIVKFARYKVQYRNC